MSSVSIIIPAFNESRNLEGVVSDILPLLEKQDSYEIFIINDYSSDDTGAVADKLAAKNPNIRAIHNTQNMGLGYNYKKGVELSTKDYVLMIPGDREIHARTYEFMFDKIGQADILPAYTTNMKVRPLSREIVSKIFTVTMNVLFGMNLKYFNGIVMHRREIIQSVRIETDGFAYQAEALIKLIKAGHSYLEVPQWIVERQFGSSKAFHPRNVARVVKTIFQLFYQIHFKKQ